MRTSPERRSSVVPVDEFCVSAVSADRAQTSSRRIVTSDSAYSSGFAVSARVLSRPQVVWGTRGPRFESGRPDWNPLSAVAH
jgi:hypothetical protein